MYPPFWLRLIVTSMVLLAAVSAPARAQSDAPVGVRAAGMGGAFVAVADDASAVFWNPAGLASGSYFSLVIDRNAVESDDQLNPRNRSGLLFAAGAPPIGVGYYRTRTVTLIDTPVPASHADKILQSLTAHHAGVTLVQTIAPGVAVGADVKLVRASAAAILTNGASGIDADDLPAHTSTKFDTDFGVMVSRNTFRAGVQVRNAFEPSFPTANEGVSIALERRIRAGAAVRLAPTLTVSADADLTKVTTTGGRWRDAALGTEARLSRRLWGRAGIHWNTAGGDGTGAAPVTSLGASVNVYGSMLADAQVSFGSSNGDRGWGVGARIVF